MLKKRIWAKVLIIFLFVAAYFIFYAVKFDGERIVSTAPVSCFYLQFNVLNTYCLPNTPRIKNSRGSLPTTGITASLPPCPASSISWPYIPYSTN